MINKLNSSNKQTVIKDLGNIRERIKKLKIPTPTYAGILINKGTFNIAESSADKISFTKDAGSKDDLTNWLNQRAKSNKCKFIAAGLIGNSDLKKIGSDLWLGQDIIPFIMPEVKYSNDDVKNAAVEVESNFDKNSVVKIKLGKYNEVPVMELASIEDYRAMAPIPDMDRLAELAERFKNRRIVFISATPRGGGVAIMRHTLIRILRLFGVDAHWHVMIEKAEVFDITKAKFHNVLQDVADSSVRLNEKDKKIYNSWIAENAEMLEKVFKEADVIVIDDPQPSGLIPYIKKMNPNARVIFRSHIQIVSSLSDKAGTPQYDSWQFIWNNIKNADIFISHPVKDFVPSSVPLLKTAFMPPAAIDPLDGLNKKLSQEQTEYYLKLFDKTLLEINQEPLDREKPYILQIARFDPSKGIPDVIESYRKLRERMEREQETIPQLVIVGHGSVDDPDGVPTYNLILEMLQKEKYAHLVKDVKIAKLIHIDQLLNTLVNESRVVLQLSHREGFEFKVTEALMEGKPVIAYQTGGIPLQIEDGVTGFIVNDIGDTDKVSELLYGLFSDDKGYKRMSKKATENARRDMLSISNAINWLFLANSLLENNEFQGNGANVRDLAF